MAADTTNPSEFWRKNEHYRDSIVAKLVEVGRADVTSKIAECGKHKMYVTCANCYTSEVVFNHCDLKWCPLCMPRLSAKRRESIEVWKNKVTQPKHVVLTQRNTYEFNKRYVRHAQAQISKLRRNKLTGNWNGGIVSDEVTLESRGWHLHHHLLVDSRWIDKSQLAVTWGKLVGQDFAIVEVKDCRDEKYLQEVTKYAVKGSSLATWSAEDILTFVFAFTGVRTFRPFGTCFKMRAEVATFKEEIKRARARVCECGCKSFSVTESIGGTMPTKAELTERNACRCGIKQLEILPPHHLPPR